jgi:hypothetical protein
VPLQFREKPMTERLSVLSRSSACSTTLLHRARATPLSSTTSRSILWVCGHNYD